MALKCQNVLEIVIAILILSILWDINLADVAIDKIKGQKLPAEFHYVQTDDGYILGVHRIVRHPTSRNYRGVMFLMHGMGGSSPCYIMYPNVSAGYYFWMAGYDIWMGNARGNSFSRNHTTLSPDDAEFWKFSWHEIGYYDLPAMIDYALNATHQADLMYIGHSQGVTSAFVMLTTRPEYNRRVQMVHAMTPPVFLKHPPLVYSVAIVDMAMKNINLIEDVVEGVRMYEVFSKLQISKAPTIGKLCQDAAIMPICRLFIAMAFGPSSHYYDKLLEAILDHVPSSMSYRQVLHYGVLCSTGEFKHYDHGPKENLRLHGVEAPPSYNLSRIRTRIHIIYGGNDKLVMAANIPLLQEKIKRYVFATSEFGDYNHIDFVYSKDILRVQEKISAIISRYKMIKKLRI